MRTDSHNLKDLNHPLSIQIMGEKTCAATVTQLNEQRKLQGNGQMLPVLF